jgi:hypothetical protein
MVRKIACVDLKAIVPTAEEKAKALARRALMDDKAKRSVKVSVRTFWKQNVDANTGSISEVSDELVDKWLTHLSRCENSDKSVTDSRMFNTKSKKLNELRWYGKEILLRDFGQIRGQYWLDTGLLPKRTDRNSHKHGEFITEHGVPDDYEQLTEEDFRQLRAQVEFELSKEDGAEELDAFTQVGKALQNSSSSISNSFSVGGRLPGDTSSSEVGATVKIEVPTAGEIMADKVETLKATKDPTLARMRMINLDTRTMWGENPEIRERDRQRHAADFHLGVFNA